MQKSVAFLCTNNEISERESKKKISLLKSHQKNLGINLTKEVKDLYAEKYKTLIKDTAAAAAKSLQSCPTLCDPIDGSPLSLGFSRQEYWNGLPFPSPMHESEK